MDFKGKRIACLGDSITEGAYTPVGERYFDVLSGMLGAEVKSFGKNGAQTRDLFSQLDAVKAELSEDVDLIMVFIGTNDFYGNVPLGEWFTEELHEVVRTRDEQGAPAELSTRRVRSFSYDMGTFKGRLNSFLTELRRSYPTKEIALLTPIHRAFATFGPKNIQYDELHSNDIGIFFEEYVAAVRQAADLYSLRLCDLYRDSGLFPLEDGNAKTYFSNTERDRLHPNKFGHARIGRVLAGYLSAW